VKPDVVVAGAGAGGLASARALGALGLHVLVLDRRAAPATVAKGEILQPETIRILDRWAALEALHAAGARPVSRLAIRDPEGRPLLCLEYGLLPGPYRQIFCADYADLQAALADGLASGVQIRRGVRVGGVLRDRDGRIAGVQVAGDGTDPEIRAPLVIAADGMSSRLRKAAGVEVDRKEYPHRLLAFDVAGADVADEVSAYRTGRGLCLVYPLPGGRCRLYVQVRPDEFRDKGMTALTGWCDRLLADVPAIRPLETAVRASLHRRQLLAVYRLRAERLSVPGLALVGEAAHAVHPMAAQGVNSSLADAEAINARATALAGQNQALIAANKLVDMLPPLVEAAAHGLEGSSLTVLNGSQGLSDIATGVAAQGLAVYQTLRDALAAGADGRHRRDTPADGEGPPSADRSRDAVPA